MTEANFVDYVKLNLKSGKGGKGSVHLHREKFITKGGPDGGDGGRGGHIVIRANSNLWTLYPFKFTRHYTAGHGGDGSKNRSSGAQGKDVFIDVPLGTVVKNSDTGAVLFEIVESGQEFILLEGGKGGLGNWNFKSSTNQTPRYAQPGIPGQEINVTLELKVLADVGLVGFPNAGKSTLLAALTAAKPKIADYEFTTLKPNLGIVPYRDFQSFVMADIPGIIEGAAEGKGLGHYFLRHIERNSVLLFLIPADTPDVKKAFDILMSELKTYNPELIDKDYIVALSKCDLLDEELRMEYSEEMKKNFGEIPHCMISAVAQSGLLPLKDIIWKILNAPHA
ncbi:GTPase ObgE [Flavobacteriaceae bacterium]|nr:GTPase ObgE [Flavobacteriaceae bacterium]MDA8763368.1 GTPase ObgE [Flavobacteriaceae bacterium]MDC3238961.1 GTPase ObgE [Flavobacteriaceae bacterium]